jgi:putative solute:sodium symporter small subunit
MHADSRQTTYWQRNLRLTGILLAIWFLVTFVVIWFARELNQFFFAGFPLAFYMGAQGALLVYVLIIRVYADQMNAMDEEYGIDEDAL